jgi:uncharacterized surface protein with fasciclin (FAS1) repeats
MTVPRWFVVATAVGALGFGVAACGGDDAADATAPSVTTTALADPGGSDGAGSGSTETDRAGSATEPATVVEVATGDADFSTLVTAVKSAGLVDTLSGTGPFTVFAPTNEAFDALPAGTVDDLLRPENKAQLTSVLTYHVVPGEVLSKSLTDGMVVTTVEGETLTVGVGADGVTLTDAAGNRATVAKADIEAGNGVVHVIDGVLLPAS